MRVRVALKLTDGSFVTEEWDADLTDYRNDEVCDLVSACGTPNHIDWDEVMSAGVIDRQTGASIF